VGVTSAAPQSAGDLQLVEGELVEADLEAAEVVEPRLRSLARSKSNA
jgi:hypothetical protein